MLKELCLLNGISGREKAVREYIISKIPSDCKYSVDALGNVIVEKPGKSRAKKKVMLSAHMDEVGFMVNYITDDGYIKITPVGGIDERVVFGRRVSVSGIPGVIGSKALHHLSSDELYKVPKCEDMFVDIGAETGKQAREYVRLGDEVNFESEYVEFGDGFIKAKALDDRVGCQILLDILASEQPYDLTVCFVVQEEIGTRGSAVAAYNVMPDYAIVLECTTAADIPDTPEHKKVCKLGNGAVVSYMDRGTVYDFELYKKAFSVAEKNGIKCQTKTVVAGGNDAAAIHKSGKGVRTAAISVPTRYIHSPSCVAKKEDIEAVALLAQRLAEELAND